MDGGVHIGPGDMVLGKYRVERVIGLGGMGFIVAARHVALGELFAIKLMLPSFSTDPEARERFLREARAAARLKGDHIAKVQDVGCLPDGTSYMVMEYLAGEDLKKIVRRSGAFPIGEAVEYALQTCMALREAHALGIVHRDVKPANLMLVPRPDGAPRIKVIDFGISKHTADVVEGLTGNNWAGGSPSYMAPEQIRSARNVDVRADVWSMGVVLYELFTGVTPFHATSVPAVLHRVLHEDPVPPCVLRDTLPTALGDVVMRCLSKQPEDRYQTIDELVEALRAAAPGEGAVPSCFEDLPARASLLSIPYDTALPAVSSGAVTDGETPRPSSSALEFGAVASVPPAAPSAPRPPNRRALRAVGAAVLVALGAVMGGLLWLFVSPAARAVASGSGVFAGEAASEAAPAVPAAPRPAPPPPAPPPAPASASAPLVSPSPAETEIRIAMPGAASTSSPPKTAAGEQTSAPSRPSTSRNQPARPQTRAAAAGAARRKPEPLY